MLGRRPIEAVMPYGHLCLEGSSTVSYTKAIERGAWVAVTAAIKLLI